MFLAYTRKGGISISLFLYMHLRILLLTLGIGFSLLPEAQPGFYPKNYFRNPLGIPMELEANFGELRPDHWHMGLDLRTEAKENQLVYAAADGYIVKVGIRPAEFWTVYYY